MLSYVMLCCVNYINYLNKEYKKFTINIRIFFMLLCFCYMNLKYLNYNYYYLFYEIYICIII